MTDDRFRSTDDSTQTHDRMARTGDRGIGRRTLLRTAGTAAGGAVLGTAGVAAAVGDEDDRETIGIDYDDHDEPADVYDVWDVRSAVEPAFAADPTDRENTVLEYEFNGDPKVANCCYALEDGGNQPTEVYSRFSFYPNGDSLGADDTVRIYWAGLNIDAGIAGSGVQGPPSGTDGWSIAIGYTNRENPPAGTYNFFTYTYHLDQGSSSGEFEVTDAAIPMDEWTDIECYVRLNTHENGVANHDGVSRIWIDDELAYERSDFRWTTTDDQGVEYVGPLGYVVGSQHPRSVYYDDHEIVVGGLPDDRAD